MPIFEYRCTECAREFEAFVTTTRTAECPGCHGASLQKLLSRPGMVGAAAAPSTVQPGPVNGGCGAGGADCACRSGMN